MKDIFYYVSACAGSGKTTAAIKSIEKATKLGERFVIAQPTVELCKATAASLVAAGVKTRLITRELSPGTVRSEFVQAIHRRADSAVVITHAALLQCSGIAQKAKWNLIVDEVLPVDTSYLRNVSLNYGNIICHLDIIPNTRNDSILDVKAKHSSIDKVTAWARNVPGDEVTAVLQPFWQMVVNPHCVVGINRSQHALSSTATQTQLIAHGVLMPTVLKGWSRVTIMAANFEQSLMYKFWTAQGIDFRPDPAITVSQPRHTAIVGGRATIRYLTEANWTKTLRNSLGGIAAISQALAPHVHGDYIWAANKDVADGDWKVPGGERIPVMAQGFNHLRHHTQAIFLAALNDNPAHIKWAKAQYGIDPIELGTAKSMETAYQMVMRTNLRETSATVPVEITVVDRRTADYLASLLPTAKVEFLDIGIAALSRAPASGASRKPPKTDAERKRRHDERKRQYKEAIANLTTLTGGIVGPSLALTPTISFEANKFSKSVHSQNFRDFDEVKNLLRAAWEAGINRKEDNFLMSGAVFSPTADSQTTKGLDAFMFAQLIQLDFDDSDLHPDVLREMLWDIRHIAYNSFSNVMEHGRYRYRVVVPLAAPVTKEVYEALWDILARRVEEAGFATGKSAAPGHAKSGLDRSKRTPVSWMYMPARAASARNSFWIENWEAPAMNSVEFLDRIVADELQPEINLQMRQAQASIDVSGIVSTPVGGKTLAITEALEAWQRTPAGMGNANFFRFGLDLKRAGCGYDEIRQLLQRHHADSASNASHRKAQINGILRSLQRQRHFKESRH